MAITLVINRRRAAVALAAAVGLVFVIPQSHGVRDADAASGTPIFVTCTGAQSGKIVGGVVAKGFEGYMGATSATHGVTTPIDAASGLPSGKRQHKPITFTKVIDKATPVLHKVQTNNELLTSCLFRFWKPVASTGQIVEYYRITIRNGHVVNNSFTGSQTGSDTETWSITYDSIEWRSLEAGIITTDTWGGPIS